MRVEASAPRNTATRTPAWRLAAATVVAAALLTGSGCGSLAQAQQTVGRADLVNDLAGRLTAAGELTYTAEYQLRGGGAGAIAQAQEPLRTTYSYPDGELTVTVEATTECERAGAQTTCLLTAPPAPGANATARLFAEPGELGLVPPALVIGLLTAAGLDADAVIEQKDTTIAGEHATCVSVEAVDNAAASAFEACITTAGVLGSFSGAVNGADVDMTMTRYLETVAPYAFSVPAGAAVVDRRSGAK
ncbi:MAG TPA: hypothetical protein VFR67_12245 [Pilimelia sp.]|nr:hypothetical protein [Pilimelia sp.]